jgi:uncharacterized membrane protein YeaQ/YmgE (transglycosylase-associated protein family)
MRGTAKLFNIAHIARPSLVRRLNVFVGAGGLWGSASSFGVIHQPMVVSNLIQICVAVERRLVTMEPLPQRDRLLGAGKPGFGVETSSTRANPSGALMNGGSKMHMSGESFLVILVVGLIAGWLAGQIVQGTGFGIVGDIIIGIVGAFIGSWLLPQLGIHLGAGLVAAIINATIGALILLFIIRLARGRGGWRWGWRGNWGRR